MVNQQIIDDGTRLSPEDLAVLRDDLLEQRAFREEQLRQITTVPTRADDRLRRRSAAQTEVRVQLAASAQTEVRVQLAASARMVLADVEAALDRMAEGRYGSCHLCRRPIARERLAIVPQARYCARCQQVREAGR
ncbi:TraR/DksA C4-type zinc finger protein [Streptomyces flaveolus]|uniref:TraR/DksA family transcriptional regulator n=1 Tax=Streptomyces flaveolus TaxID=67297 RepID=UPI0033E20796